MGTYTVPEDYNYLTGGVLKRDKRGKVKRGQLTPNTLDHLLFGAQISEDNPNKEDFERRPKIRKYRS